MNAFGKTILVVEDDRNDQVLIEKAFRAIGVTEQIIFAGDGAEAIAYMCGDEPYADRKEFPYPTLILTDLKMPRMDGFEVLAFLRKNPMWSVVPTVVLSASQDMDDLTRAYLLGASAYHVKPQTFERLMEQLRVMRDYWLTCEVPPVDSTGKMLSSCGKGKLGERFSVPLTSKEHPVR